MNTIYKYPFEISDYQEIVVPWGAAFLHAGLDPHGQPCFWAQVNTGETRTNIWRVWIYGTGHPIPSGLNGLHVGSFVDKFFVWHVFLEVK